MEEQAKMIESQLGAARRRLDDVRKNRPAEGSQQAPYYPPTPYGYPAPSYGTPTPQTAPSPDEEVSSLEKYKRELGDEVKGVEARIEELKKLREKESEG